MIVMSVEEYKNSQDVVIEEVKKIHADLQEKLNLANKKIEILESIADEYDCLIRYMDAGGNFFEFMELRKV